MTRQRAYTLLELIATLVVLGILAAIAVPTYASVIQHSRERAAATTAEAVGNDALALARFDEESATQGDHLETAAAETSDETGPKVVVLRKEPAQEKALVLVSPYAVVVELTFTASTVHAEAKRTPEADDTATPDVPTIEQRLAQQVVDVARTSDAQRTGRDEYPAALHQVDADTYRVQYTKGYLSDHTTWGAAYTLQMPVATEALTCFEATYTGDVTGARTHSAISDGTWIHDTRPVPCSAR